MDVTRMIQIAVAKADIAICFVLALPWKRMALSLILAAIIIRVIKAAKPKVWNERGNTSASSEVLRDSRDGSYYDEYDI